MDRIPDAIDLLSPLRGPISWACQKGWLPIEIRRVLPWRWSLQPFTLYGDGWECRWFPTEFDDIARVVFWSGFRRWERETAPVIIEHLKSSRCFVDVGANCGIYTVAGAVVNPALRIIEIEPVPKIMEALANNVRRNGIADRVTLVSNAIGNRDGVVDFHMAENPLMGSLNAAGYKGQSGTVITVECRRLDGVIDELGARPDFIKIDVEGFEDAVLEGAGNTLQKFRPHLVLEANPGDPCTHMTELLRRHRYTMNLITEAGPLRREEIVADERYRNWLCAP